MITTIISSLITGGVVALLTWFISLKTIEGTHKKTIGSAEERAKEIVENAQLKADTIYKEAEISAKESALQMKKDMENEVKEQRNEVQQYEKRVIAKEEAIDKKFDAIEERTTELAKKEEQLALEEDRIEEIKQSQLKALEDISGLSSQEARDILLKNVEEEVKEDSARIIRTVESETREEAEKRARDIIVRAISRCDVDQISEATVSVVELPGDDMKGRIIGREGRNIRTFETLTGVELIVDDTPEAVVLSCFNPIRRQIAKMSLEKLVVDGRIHPARIEEMVQKSTNEVEATIKQKGEEAVMDLGLHGIHPEIIKLLGRMHYRTSYGQNVLKHSIEVALLTGLLAAEVGEDEKLAKRAGLLHDIGKAVDFEMEGTHVQIGSEICRKYKESGVVINAVESHHGDVEADNLISVLVQCADAISAARPGARREDMEVYINRLKRLEEIADSHQGVEKSFAIQAGREVRVMVVPEEVSDADMVIMARKISKQIEEELQYPGQIKVNIVRESRAVDYAK